MVKTTPKITILIPSLESRKGFLSSLMFSLNEQMGRYGLSKRISILKSVDNGEATIGAKRNELLQSVTTEYCCFFDDDDMPSEDYLSILFHGVKSEPDCLSLRGLLNIDGKADGIFEHSIKYDKYQTKPKAEIKYERYPNHLNVIRTEIAKCFKFKEINHGEDTDWATQIHQSKFLKNEVYSDKLIYFYNYNSKK